MAKARSRIRWPRRKGNWFAAVTTTAGVNVAAGVQTNINILTAFDEPVTVVRMVGDIFMHPQADVAFYAKWMLWLNRGGDSGMDLTASGDIQREDVMHLKNVFTHSTHNGAFASPSHVDVKVKRKLFTESHIVLSLYSATAYTYYANLRAYVLFA